MLSSVSSCSEAFPSRRIRSETGLPTSRTAVLALFLLLGSEVVVAGGCAASSSTGPDGGPDGGLEWKPLATNPVIRNENQFNGPFWNDPSILNDGSEYIMYLTRNVDGPVGPLTTTVLPFRATSPNGINWTIGSTSLLSSGTASEFDFRVETPDVVIFNGMYHMYYTGLSTAGPSDFIRVGHATSPDGINWTKDLNNPVLSPSGTVTDWNGFHLAEPGAVVFKNQIYLYFAAVGVEIFPSSVTAFRSVGLAISNDGSNFGPHLQVVTLDETIYPRAQGYEGYSTPNALVYDGEIHLFYDIFQQFPGELPPNDFVQVALHHAVSPNGINNWTQDRAPLFVRGSPTWRNREIRSPAVIHDGASTLKMWFAGDDALGSWEGGIGLATAFAPLPKSTVSEIKAFTEPGVIKRIVDHLRKRDRVSRPPPRVRQPAVSPA